MKTPLRYLFVSGLGRREIGNRASLLAALKAELKLIEDVEPEAQAVALASGAAGADQVFLEAARALHWPIRILLPVPRHLFEEDFTRRKSAQPDVTDEAGLNAFRELCAAAIDVEVIAPAPGRHAGFARTAEELVRRADVVVALWDGAPGAAGGTSEALAFIAAEKKPLLLLDAKEGKRMTAVPAPTPDAIRSAVAARHDSGILADISLAVEKAEPVEGLTGRQRLAAATKAGGSGEAAAGAETLGSILEQVLKDGARSLSDKHRSRNIRVLGLHIAATVVGLVGLTFFATEADGLAAGVIAVLKLALVVWAFVQIRRVQRERENLRWARSRYVREIGRSLARTAMVSKYLGQPVAAFVPSSIWSVFGRLRLPLTTFYAVGQSARKTPVPSLDQVMADYGQLAFARETWENSKGETQKSQFRYMQDEGTKAEHRRHQVHTWVHRCLLLMVSAAALGLLLPLFPVPKAVVKVAKFVSVFSPVLAASLLVLPNLNDWNRRATVDTSVAEQLEKFGAQLEGLRAQLRDPMAVASAGAAGTALWRSDLVGDLDAPDPAKVREAVERMVANRFAAIVVETEAAVLTELIGFKTFVESVELA